MNNVTVVIPVYKDWETLNECIVSLKQYVETKHQVILVNDMSSDWETLEIKILELIQGFHNFHYYKNEENIGFVKTCNRAIKELDRTNNDILLLNSDTKVTEGFLEEMIKILYQAEKHGVVCPRSNNATILSVPVKKNFDDMLSPEESHRIFECIKNRLPEKQVIPTAVGFAMLIKRSLLQTYGVLDEAYGHGYNEENDFCMRINQYGYNVVMANRAYVYHFESKSFGSRKEELELINRGLLLKRYPHYPNIVNWYFNKEMNPVDYFADMLVENVYKKKRILYSLYELPSAFNGTAEYGLSLLNAFLELYGNKYDIHILTSVDADKFFKISEKYKNVCHPHDIQGTFHIAFIPSQIFNIEHMFLINRTCLKYIFCMQDIISIRSSYLAVKDIERVDVFKKSIKYCDAMTSISEFSLNDTKAYYCEEFEEREIQTKIIYHGTNKTNKTVFQKSYDLAFEKYFIIFGNQYKHKFLEEIMDCLKSSKHNFIIIGSKDEGKTSENIYGYRSGMLSSDLIDYIINNSEGILFPSVYEGFGLPILNGIDYDKKIVVNNNELNRELRDSMPSFQENIYLFDDKSEIEGLLDILHNNPVVKYKDDVKVIRPWKEAAIDVEEFIERILNCNTDDKILCARWNEMRYLENYHRCYVVQQTASNPTYIKELSGMEKIKNFLHLKCPKVYWGLRNLKAGLRK